MKTQTNTNHGYDHCPDCGTSCIENQKECYYCGYNFFEDEPTESESIRGIDPFDY